MTATSFKLPQIGIFSDRMALLKGPKCGESYPGEILMKIDLSERALLFFGL